MPLGTIQHLDIRPPDALLSDDLLLRLSDQHRPCKVERTRHGEITIMTPVGGVGSTHEIFVASALFNWTESEENGVAFGSSAGFNLPDTSCLSPGAAWISSARWNALTPEQRAGFPPLCPEFIIEIRSRTDSRVTLEEKMQRWLENGAELAWLLDPILGQAILYNAGEPPRTLDRPEFLSGNGCVAGFELRTARLWSSPA